MEDGTSMIRANLEATMASDQGPLQSGAGESDDSSPRSVLPTSPDTFTTSSSDTDSTTSSVRKTTPGTDTAISATGGHGQWRSFVRALKTKSMRRLATFPPVSIGSGGISKRSLDRRLARLRMEDDDAGADEDAGDGHVDTDIPKPSLRCFGSDELITATNNFSPENLIGKGGHAHVYRGLLPDGELVAVKRLIWKVGEDEPVGDFLAELGITAHIDHPNVARLLGTCAEDGLHFVLQLSPRGSLDSLLYGSEPTLDWENRFKVALGVAEGLLYLHHGCKRRVIHRDIKAANILLEENYEPKITDFGLAKWLPQHWTHRVVYPIEGTFGYLAPEYFIDGIVDEKTDVFAFGVLLLELITGRNAVDSSRQSLVMWAKPILEEKNLKELVDPKLKDAYNRRQVKRLMITASICTNHVANKRPHMKQVVQILNGDEKAGIVMSKEHKSVGVVKAMLLSTFDVDDYTTSKYLNDLKRHEQLVLESNRP